MENRPLTPLRTEYERKVVRFFVIQKYVEDMCLTEEDHDALAILEKSGASTRVAARWMIRNRRWEVDFDGGYDPACPECQKDSEFPHCDSCGSHHDPVVFFHGPLIK